MDVCRTPSPPASSKLQQKPSPPGAGYRFRAARAHQATHTRPSNACWQPAPQRATRLGSPRIPESADSTWRFSADDDPEWDAFVASTPGGHHVQTSRWARVKAILGWRAARVVVYRQGKIAGGAQLLIRDLPRAGAIAYAPRAPLTGPRDQATLMAVLDAVHSLARHERLLYLKLQPPSDRHDASPVIERNGFVRSNLDAGPTATVRVPLDREPAALLAAMRSSTRANIRRAQRKGVAVRSGSAADLDAFFRVVEQTSRRQQFKPYPAAYYYEMWRQFGADGHARLLLGELDGRVLTAVLVIGWGDSVLYKMGGWTGLRRDIHPNELAHWHAIQWARECGYRFYDFEGISVGVAHALLAGRQPEGARSGVNHFKLGFGGEVTIFPGALDIGYGWGPSALVRVLAPRLATLRSLAHSTLGRGSSGSTSTSRRRQRWIA